MACRFLLRYREKSVTGAVVFQNSPHTRALTRILHTDMTAEEIREERLAKYLK